MTLPAYRTARKLYTAARVHYLTPIFSLAAIYTQFSSFTSLL